MIKPPCPVCHKPMVRRAFEHTGNWKRRVTCSPVCAIKRNNRLRAWSEADIAIAIRMHSENCDPSTIGQRLGRRRTAEAVRAKLKSLLVARKSKPRNPPTSKAATIPCLKCTKPFKSVDRTRNRLCARCAYRNTEEYENTACIGALV